MQCNAAMGDMEIAACFNILIAQCSTLQCLLFPLSNQTLGPLFVTSLFMIFSGCVMHRTHARQCVCGTINTTKDMTSARNRKVERVIVCHCSVSSVMK